MNLIPPPPMELLIGAILLFFYAEGWAPWRLYAAPEWQARSMWWRSRELMAACPLEGLVRSCTLS